MAELTPEARALLETIAGPESSGNYDIIYGGGRFTDFADHPRQYVTITSGPNKGQKSSAAGKYQFLGSTWDDISSRYGLNDFSPESQDMAAWALAQEEYKRDTGRDLQADLAAGDLSRVAPSLKNQWTSMPGGIEQGISGSAFSNAYAAALGGAGGMKGAMVAPATAAVRAIDAAAPQVIPAVMRGPAKPGGGIWSNIMAPIKTAMAGAGAPLMRAASNPNVQREMVGNMFGTVGGRTAIVRALMSQNIGSAPTVSQGHSGGGTRALAVTGGNAVPVTLMRTASRSDSNSDGSNPSGMNKDIYRANAAVLGSGGFTQPNIDRVMASGKTLYKLA